MQSNLSRLVLVTLLFLLVTSCSSVESEPEGLWNGVWRYQAASALMEARLTQEGDQVTGTIEYVSDGGQFHRTYGVEATAKDTLASGVLILPDTLDLPPGHPSLENRRMPFHMAMQGDSIQVFLPAASSFPFLRKVKG